MNTSFERKNHKTKKIIIIIIMILSIIGIGILSYLLYLNIQSRPLIEYPKYTLSTTEWTSSNVVVTILNDNNNISSYSFDGGNNFQEINTYEVTNNTELNIMVKDINGRKSKMLPISIRNIDKEPPIINFESNTTIQVGSRFSLRNGVNVTDFDSGLSNNYVITPDSIDTNVIGEYLFTYTAFDKAGNYTEKERKIIITDIKGTIYYRYRDGVFENYQCDSYLCNCEITESAKITNSCPKGYTFTAPDKCCQTCNKTCRRVVWGEWSEWSTNKVVPNSTREVETKIE